MDHDNLNDLIVPLLLEKSDDFKPLVAKRRFLKAAELLAKQAYWMVWFETLARMAGKLDGARVRAPDRAGSGRANIQVPVWAKDFVATARDEASFEAARKRAKSKLHGAGTPDEEEVIPEGLGGSFHAIDHVLRLSDQDAVMVRVLGRQLWGFKTSKAERGELEKILWEGSPAAASKGKARSL